MMIRPGFIRRLVWESLRSGTIASLAMMPFGLLFRALDLRVGLIGGIKPPERRCCRLQR